MATIILPSESEKISDQENESSEDENEEMKLNLSNEDEVSVSPEKRSATLNKNDESTKISDRDDLSQEDEKIAKDSGKMEIAKPTEKIVTVSKSFNTDDPKIDKDVEKSELNDPKINTTVEKIIDCETINEQTKKSPEDPKDLKINAEMNIPSKENNQENKKKRRQIIESDEEDDLKLNQEDDLKANQDEDDSKLNQDDEGASKSNKIEKKGIDSDPKDDKSDEANNFDNLQIDENNEKLPDDKRENDVNNSKMNEEEKNLPESDEDDDNFGKFKFVKKSSQGNGKKFALVDSDSDNENIFISRKQNNEDSSSVSEMSVNSANDTKSKKKSRILKIVDSDTEDDSQPSGRNSPEEKSQKANNSKKLSIVDTDSENDARSSDEERDRFDEKKKKFKKSNIKDLIDSDNSDSDGNKSTREFTENLEQKSKAQKGQKRKGSARASKDAAMQQIHSESQRLIRESEVSLPYHRPKQRTLQEFLNRKKISSSLPKTLTTAAKVKMFDHLIIKAVEEKEKEVETFYKSSDSEEEIEEEEKVEKERVENERLEKERVEKERIEKERVEKEKIEKERVEKEKIEKERVDKDTVEKDKNELNQSPKNLEDTPMDVDLSSNETAHFPSDVLSKEETQNSANTSEEANDKSISHVSRKLFEDEIESEESRDESTEKNSDEKEVEKTNSMEVNTNENNFNKSNQTACNETENNVNTEPMETDTNDFELRFSANDFDTELFLKDVQGNWKSESLSKSELQSKANSEGKLESKSESKSELKSKLDSEDKVESDSDDKSESASKWEANSEDNNEFGERVVEITDKSSSLEEKDDDGGLASAVSKGHVLGLPPPSVEDEILRKKTLKEKILSRFLNVKPTFHGSPGTTIELFKENNQDGVKKLLDRFVRHSHVHKVEENPDVTVLHTEVTPEGLKIVEQVLPYKIPNATEESDMNKPGAKLQKLREDLQQKIINKRNEEWRQKEEASKDQEDEFDDELEPEDKDGLPNEEEEFEEEITESEPEENDIIIKENKKSNCAFADDEAEVSDDENQLPDDEEEALENERKLLRGDDENEEENDENEENEENDENEEENEDEDENDDEDKNEHEDKNDEYEDEDKDKDEDKDEDKGEDDEDDENKLEAKTKDKESTGETKEKKKRRIMTAFEDDSDPETEKVVVSEKKTFQRLRTDADMFDGMSDGWESEDENRLKADSQSPQLSSNYQNLVTPVTQLTVLKKHANSAQDSSSKENESDQMNDSFSQDSTLGDKFSNKLFQTAPKVDEQDLLDLCSGNFTSQIRPFKPLVNSHPDVTESQLLDLCSGSFASQVDDNSQDIRLTLDEASPRKQTSRILKIVSSDEEDDEKEKKTRRKKVAKLVLSEDEDEEGKEKDDDEKEETDEEEMDGEEREETNEERETDEEREESDEENFVDYDSEENEVVMVPKKDLKKVVMKKYMEAEAELSESEWGSEDEDERDLDKLEREEGDDDEIDEDQMRKQLGKIHARQVLDDDQREVRLLQDMLFEDGDLHSEGAGRERKFRWKNIDNLGEWGVDAAKNSEDPEMIEDALEESELEIRKHRYEKEKFLEKKDSLDTLEEDLNDSDLFKCGLRVVHTVIKTSSITEESVTIKAKKPLAPSIIPTLLEKSAIRKSPSMQLPIRGSFLARGEATLARIASIIDEKDKVIRAPLNGKRFVFEHISPSVKEAENARDEESSPSTSKNMSRKRMPTSDSTPKSTKKMKVDKDTSGKKLFS